MTLTLLTSTSIQNRDTRWRFLEGNYGIDFGKECVSKLTNLHLSSGNMITELSEFLLL